jgi:hypothetical protein
MALSEARAVDRALCTVGPKGPRVGDALEGRLFVLDEDDAAVLGKLLDGAALSVGPLADRLELPRSRVFSALAKLVAIGAVERATSTAWRVTDDGIALWNSRSDGPDTNDGEDR